MRLLQNPFVKVIGIVVIIYFALFSNKENPASLANRLSGDRIKKNFNEIEEKGKFIASNVKVAHEYSKIQGQDSVTSGVEANNNASNQDVKGAVVATKEVTDNVSQDKSEVVLEKPKTIEVAAPIKDKSVSVTVKNIKNGSGKIAVFCGDQVEIATVIKDAKGKILENKKSEKLVIGSKKNDLVEKNIVNMYQGGVREIKVSQGFESSDKELDKFLSDNNFSLSYQVTVLKISRNTAAGSSFRCE